MTAIGYAAAVGQAALDAMTARLNGVDTTLAQKADTTTIMTELSHKADESELPPAVQCKKVAVAGAAGEAVWVFDQPFDVAPICAASAETPAGAAYINVATIIEGSTTTAQTRFVVQRVVRSITLPALATALLGLVLTLFGFAPAGVNVNCFARRPS